MVPADRPPRGKELRGKLLPKSEATIKKNHTEANRPRIKEEVIKALEQYNGYVEDACAIAGIPRKTYYEWRKSDPEFKAACNRARNHWLKKREAWIVRLGDHDTELYLALKANMFILEQKGKAIGYNKGATPAPVAPAPEAHKMTPIDHANIEKHAEKKFEDRVETRVNEILKQKGLL
jgi:hypothetical protein